MEQPTMEFVATEDHLGTSESRWAASSRLRDLPPLAQGIDLPRMRHAESSVALGRLGLRSFDVVRLGMPDGSVGHHVRWLSHVIGSMLRPGDLCLAPWWRDGHPDHEPCGDAALVATKATDARLLGYLVWAWHWGDPDGFDLPWADCRRFDFRRRMAARKRWATGAFHSQTRPLSPDYDGALLPGPLLRRFWRPYVVCVDATDGSR